MTRRDDALDLPDLYWNALAIIVCAGIFLGGTFVSPTGLDVFRFPKVLVLRASAILLAAAWLIGVALGILRSDAFSRLRDWKVTVGITLAAIAWTAITTATSTNRLLSLQALGEAACAALIFLSALFVARTGRSAIRRALPLASGVAAAVVNAFVSLCQTFDVWQPIPLDPHYGRRLVSRSAFVGNPNEVGCYLAGASLVAIVAVVVVRRRAHRIASGAMATFLVVALVINQTRTALLALICGVFLLSIVMASKRALGILAIGLTLMVTAVALAPGFFVRIPRLSSMSVQGVDRLVSGRLIAFASAAEIFREHPLVGSGPGTFGWQFMPHRLEAEARYPALLDVLNRDVNFAEVHNDLLEVLSETGIPGLLVMLAALGTVAFGSAALIRRRWLAPETPTDGTALVTEFGIHFSAPLAATFLVLTLAQFPLQVASSTSLYLALAATAIAWSRP